MDAIHRLGHELVAVFDPHDSVGILDRYAPKALYFNEIERFDRHLSKLKQIGEGVDYISICSPNYLHDAHARLGLRLGADVICEKPLVLNTRNAVALQQVEKETQRNVWCILQARLHPEIKRLQKAVTTSNSGNHKVTIDYITPRGPWYDYSWKGDVQKSGGIATNIGVHLFDLVTWLFGPQLSLKLMQNDPRNCIGQLRLERADVTFTLSVDLDAGLPQLGKKRSFSVDGEAYDLTRGFEDLHVAAYQDILEGKGFGIGETIAHLEVIEGIREEG